MSDDLIVVCQTVFLGWMAPMLQLLYKWRSVRKRQRGSSKDEDHKNFIFDGSAFWPRRHPFFGTTITHLSMKVSPDLSVD